MPRHQIFRMALPQRGGFLQRMDGYAKRRVRCVLPRSKRQLHRAAGQGRFLRGVPQGQRHIVAGADGQHPLGERAVIGGRQRLFPQNKAGGAHGGDRFHARFKIVAARLPLGHADQPRAPLTIHRCNPPSPAAYRRPQWLCTPRQTSGDRKFQTVRRLCFRRCVRRYRWTRPPRSWWRQFE